MTFLKDYHQFDGIRYETGTVRNVLEYQGVTAAHTGKSFSEAMLFGISGGICVLYFTFAYENEAPEAYIGTQLASPTDKPLSALCTRLGITARPQETPSQQKALTHLTNALDAGQPALVWVGPRRMPYLGLEPGLDSWMGPVVVYGYDDTQDVVNIADRARVPLTCTTGELAHARLAQSSVRNKMMTLDASKLCDLPTAVTEGIRASANAMLVGPAKGPKGNFGLAALRKWADLLTASKGWPRMFPPGPFLYGALTSTFTCIETRETGGSGSRTMYADFLDEASMVLNKPGLKDIAEQFRAAAFLWSDIARTLLPENVPLLHEARTLLLRRYQLFIEQGATALPAIKQCHTRLKEIETEAGKQFPLNDAQVKDLLQDARGLILKLHDAEKEAVEMLQSVIGS